VASFIFFPCLFVLLKKAGLSSEEKKQTATCYLAVAQPPAINFDKVRQKADFNYLLTLRIATRCRYTLTALQP
jgi:hypothetical protein